jgi:hypothetical protein
MKIQQDYSSGGSIGFSSGGSIGFAARVGILRPRLSKNSSGAGGAGR